MRSSPALSVVDPHELAARLSDWPNRGHKQLATSPSPNPTTSSPISTLPPELLSEIFVFCLPEEKFPSPSQTAAPLLLTHVCRTWRELALSNSELWCALHLNYRCPKEDVPATHLWLSHSGNRPLSLSLSIDFDEQPHQAIIDLLGQHAKRWKHIRFEFQHLHCPPMYDLDLAQANVPMLSTFEFHARDISTTNIRPITRLLSGAPQLRELTWVDDLAETETLLALPLPRLTRLSLAMDYGSLDYIELLDQCANLEHIRITRPCSEIRPPRPPLLLAKLTSLNIAHDLTGILDQLILPSLRHVRVHTDLGETEHGNSRYSRIAASSSWNDALRKTTWDPQFLVKLIERSSCQLESLWINAPMKDADLVQCLKASEQSLKSLTISGGLTLGSAVVELLMPRRVIERSSSPTPGKVDAGIPDCLCPHLTELIVDTRLPNGCSLVEMVQQRMGAVLDGYALSALPCSQSPTSRISPLKRLKLQYPSGHRDISHLRELAMLLNAQKKGTLYLTIVELRMGNLRGSSAGRTRTFMYRRKVCASR